MICRNCGAMLPDDALYCGDCGHPVDGSKTVTHTGISSFTKKMKWYRIAVCCLALATAVFAAGFVMALNGVIHPESNNTVQTHDSEGDMIELAGKYVVGEDSELPAGRYNIYALEGENYAGVKIYENQEQYENDKYISSFYEEQVKGYKLKDGYIVCIDDQGAGFELVEENEKQEE